MLLESPSAAPAAAITPAAASSAESLRAYRADLLRLQLPLVQLHELLRGLGLSANERLSCASQLDEHSRDLVRAAAWALRASAPLLSDLPVDADTLDRKQDLADTLRGLRGWLELLARLCGDAHLWVQSEAQGDALSLLRQVELEATLPLRRPADHERRSVALLLPRHYADKKRRKRDPRRRGDRKQRAAAPPAWGQPDPPEGGGLRPRR